VNTIVDYCIAGVEKSHSKILTALVRRSSVQPLSVCMPITKRWPRHADVAELPQLGRLLVGRRPTPGGERATRISR
jgi:hypothetical protein